MKVNKRYACFAFAVCISLLLSACASGAIAEPSQTASVQQTPAVTEPEKTPVPAQEAETGMVSEEPSAPVQIGEDIEAMLPVMDSVVRAMKENTSEYAPEDAGFIWSTLYLAAVNYGEQLQMAEKKDSHAIAARQAMQEIASACFEDDSDLPDIPDDLLEAVSYDENRDAYAFGLSDIGDSTTKIADVQSDGDAVKVTVEFSSWDEAENYLFTLVPNPCADGIAEPVFLYSVRSVERLG